MDASRRRTLKFLGLSGIVFLAGILTRSLQGLFGNRQVASDERGWSGRNFRLKETAEGLHFYGSSSNEPVLTIERDATR